ncbi:MAG: ABC transporter substrate-binding protein [Gammaproteobacteria bacterium]|nr:ABC transporter substrate-binding protein [Gammaproteobacteria bacterium]MDE0443653.1 ABC transporter substrate-binding protein [Gammaproteobacteria bacterium]
MSSACRRHLASVAALAALSVTAQTPEQTVLPPQWFQAPQTASQLGIASFSQSPYLDGRNLPPVEQRLPDDPVVIQPYESIGEYGGTARITIWDTWQFFNWEHAVTISADMRGVLPNLAESFEVSEDGRTTTIRLRPGTRWSDGTPLTADDFMFRFNHVWLDPEMSPIVDRMVQGCEFVKLDELTFSYVFPEPNPLFINQFAQYGSHFADPMHFFKDYHPAFRAKEELDALVEEEGFVTWMAMYGSLRGWGNEDAVKVPTLRAYKVIQRTPTKMRLERNPYYFKIDPAGNQLPYIDAIDAIILLENSQMITFQAATGQLDFAAFTLKTQDIPLLKLGEVKGVNKVHIWHRLHISDVALQANYNHDDPKYRELVWGKGERRFMRALSHAIDRDQMNKTIYFGRGIPSQVTAHPTSRWYQEEWAKAHIRYDPDHARALLDELGLLDVDGDGLREYPDGSKLTITFEYLDFETPKTITMELVRDYWREVGVDVRLKSVERSLQSERAQANKMQMTLWHADKVTDILFPVVPDWFYPYRTGWEMSMWNHWARYYQTDGELGEEPPPVIRELQYWGDELRRATTEERRTEAARRLFQAQADNLWTIGTVGQAPHPVVTSTRLKNVPPTGIWGWDNRWTLAYHPSTWYFDEEAANASMEGGDD